MVSVFVRSSAMLGFSEHIQSEHPALIDGVITDDVCLGDLAAADELCQTYKLAQLAPEIELVALVGDKKYVAFTVVEHVEELRNVDVVQTHDRCLHGFQPPLVFFRAAIYHLAYTNPNTE